MPVKDVLYRAQSTASTFLFVVNFTTAADGNAALWPPCINISLKVSCFHRNGLFVHEDGQSGDGSFIVLNGLPPAFDLRLK